MYRVDIGPRARRDMRKLPPAIQDQLHPVIPGLSSNPRPAGCKKLAGEKSLWRVRSGNYRIVYEIQDERSVVLLLKVGHRREIYR